MHILPLCYLPILSENEIQQHECSDRIWVHRVVFEQIMTISEPGITNILQLTNELDQMTYGSLYSPHDEDRHTMYVPSWMYEMLDFDCENVTFQKITPDLCTSITIAPHTSHPSVAMDPETVLRDGFESFTCLIKGRTYKLWLNDTVFVVDLINYIPEHQPVVCIRNCELVLDLLPPLDLPIPPAPTTTTPEPVPESAPESAPEPVPESAPASEITHKQIQEGVRPDPVTLRSLMARAALQRIQTPQTT